MPRKLKVLIVDDDEADRMLIRRSLTRAGVDCDCIEAESVAQAIACCDRESFDLAVLDYLLPGVDGLHGIVDLHGHISEIPIVMATGSGDEAVATEAMKLGALDYIAKSRIRPDSIKRVVLGALERAALHRKIMQQQEELKRFASVLVHDLRGPLTSIRGFAGLIESEAAADSADKAAIADLSGSVARAAERMDALISTLHGYTRLDAQMALSPVDMSRVMRDTLSNLSQHVKSRGAKVTFGELPIVAGDAVLLGQLLQNLIGNSIKYCEAAIPTIHVSAAKAEDKWLFAVRDNGIGIPQDSCRAVFEPFKRLHDRSKYEGTGLGLATCKKIVERHGGEIWCESTIGKGTIVYFMLPNADTAAVRSAA